MSESREKITYLKNKHKLNKFKFVMTFHDPEVLQSHFLVFLSSRETKLLGKKPPHCMD